MLTMLIDIFMDSKYYYYNQKVYIYIAAITKLTGKKERKMDTMTQEIANKKLQNSKQQKK